MDRPKNADPKGSLKEEAADIAVAITIQSQVNPRRTIVMQTYMERDAPNRAFHELTDKLSTVIDRQEAKYDLVGARDKLVVDKQQVTLAEAQYALIGGKNEAEWKERGRQGPPKLSASERQSKSNLEQTIKGARKQIEKLEKEIVEIEAKIAKVD